MKHLNKLKVCIKGAGEMASAVAHGLFEANIRRIVMLETYQPLAVRRMVAFSEAIYSKKQMVEGVTAVKAAKTSEIRSAWEKSIIPVISDPEWEIIQKIPFDLIVDCIIAKQNLGTRKKDAPLVIGLGPGFTAGRDVHMVIETNRGHNLGRIIESGTPEPDTKEPGNICGYTVQRLLRAVTGGEFKVQKKICDHVKKGEIIGSIGNQNITAGIDGVIRGLLRSGIRVKKGLKLGDIDPVNNAACCHTISDKARNISGSVLQAVLKKYNL
jgi:xanthine dehydrogenase accessory factor